jgi:lipid IVA palmitoyltransferase
MNRSRLITALLAALSLTFAATVFADEAAEPAATSVPEGPSDAASGTPQSVVVVGSPNTAQSTESKSWYASAWDTAGQHLSDIWTKGDVELYVPFWSYHLPYAYSPEKRASYTEYPAGGGLGKGWYNASGNWEGVYVMGFQDSHAQPMYMAGYGWVPTWNPINEQSRIGIGATVFLFMRSDINGYAPTPGILPMVTAGYGPIDVQMAYIPGGEGNGNVLFWWAKYSFK